MTPALINLVVPGLPSYNGAEVYYLKGVIGLPIVISFRDKWYTHIFFFGNGLIDDVIVIGWTDSDFKISRALLPTKFQVNWSYGSGEEVKNKFSRWRCSSQLGFPIGTIFAIFDLQVTLILLSESICLSVQGKLKTDFSIFTSGGHVVHLSGSILAIFVESPRQHSCEVWLKLAHVRRRSCHIKVTNDRHWPITIAYLEHFVLMWANNIHVTCFATRSICGKCACHHLGQSNSCSSCTFVQASW